MLSISGWEDGKVFTPRPPEWAEINKHGCPSLGPSAECHKATPCKYCRQNRESCHWFSGFVWNKCKLHGRVICNVHCCWFTLQTGWSCVACPSAMCVPLSSLSGLQLCLRSPGQEWASRVSHWQSWHSQTGCFWLPHKEVPRMAIRSAWNQNVSLFDNLWPCTGEKHPALPGCCTICNLTSFWRMHHDMSWPATWWEGLLQWWCQNSTQYEIL